MTRSRVKPEAQKRNPAGGEQGVAACTRSKTGTDNIHVQRRPSFVIAAEAVTAELGWARGVPQGAPALGAGSVNPRQVTRMLCPNG